jgi:hypothetical protein
MSKAYSKPVTDAATAAQEKKPVLPPDQFKIGSKTFTYAIPRLNIPGIGVRTALEAILDEQKHDELGGLSINEFLVSIGSGAVKEI